MKSGDGSFAKSSLLPIDQPNKLFRSLRGRQVVMLTLSALSPTASVFVTGSSIFRMAGTGTAMAVLIGGLVIFLASLLVAELAAAFPNAGGIYPGVAATLGPSAGVSVATLGLVTTPPLLAFLALGFGSYVRALAPGLPLLPIAASALVAAMLLASLNIRASARVTGMMLVIEMLAIAPLVVVAVASPARGLGQVLMHPVMLDGGRLVSTPPWTVALATVSGALACAGATAASFFAEDVKGEPARVGQLVLVSAILSLTAICLPLVLVTTSAHNLTEILSAETPIARYLQISTTPAVATLTTTAIGIAVLNNIIAYLVASSRLLYATSRDKFWPAVVSQQLVRLHPRFGSPWLAVMALGFAAMACCLVDPHRLLILISGEVFTGLILVIAVTVGRSRGQTGTIAFRSPLFPLTPIAGVIAVSAFIAADWHDPSIGRPSLLLLATIALTAFILARRRLRRSKAYQSDD